MDARWSPFCKEPFWPDYYYQMRNAQKRGIVWKLTFLEWRKVWGRRIIKRGRRKGQYVMARFGDVGAYEVGNVQIVLGQQNNLDANEGRIRTERNRANIRKGIKAYWDALSDNERALRTELARAGQLRTGGNARAQRRPETRLRHSKASRRMWAKMTPEEYAARCAAISKGRRHGAVF
jgi:hypothetical protein